VQRFAEAQAHGPRTIAVVPVTSARLARIGTAVEVSSVRHCPDDDTVNILAVCDLKCSP
jgi:hypothetical protein